MISTPARVQDNDDARSFNAYATWSEAVIARAFLAAGLREDNADRRAAPAVLSEATGGVAGTVATGVPHTVS